MVKNPPAMWETWVQPLGWEDPLEKGMVTRSRILVWRIPWTEEPGRLQSMGSQRVGHDWVTSTHSLLGCLDSPSRFCGSGMWTARDKDGLSLYHSIWDIRWKDSKNGVTRWMRARISWSLVHSCIWSPGWDYSKTRTAVQHAYMQSST